MTYLRVINNSTNDGQTGVYLDLERPVPEIYMDMEFTIKGDLPYPAPPEWKGDWDASTEYVEGDVVAHGGGVWRAPFDMPVGAEPGQVTFNEVITHTRGIAVWDYERISNTTPEARHISTDDDVTDISNRPARAIVIDRTTSSAHDVTLKNLNPDIPGLSQSLGCSFYYDVDQFTGLSFPTMLPGVAQTLTIPADPRMIIGVVFGDNSIPPRDYDFEVSITNVADLVPPAAVAPAWDVVTTGPMGPAAPNLVEFLGFKPFSFSELLVPPSYKPPTP